ncbi:hypothetical protein Q7P36_002328 [Cladosporium allicinum]
MSQGSSMTAANSGSAQKGAPTAPNRSQRLPERPRDGKSKRTLIESACTACQKRKSRCDGQRPVCSRCRALRTDCGYNAEEGESRWSALRRKIRTLERERDEARDLLLQIQSRPELEAQQIYHRVRSHTPTSDMGALIQEVTNAIPANGLQRDERPQLQQQQHEHHQLPQFQQRQHSQNELQQQQQTPLHQQHQQQQQQQQPNTATFYQGSYTPSGQTANQLPPLRSIVEVPVSGTDAANLQQLPPGMHYLGMAQLPPRKTSQTSGTSSTSHSSLSSLEAPDHPTLSPRDSPSDWAQGPAPAQ